MNHHWCDEAESTSNSQTFCAGELPAALVEPGSTSRLVRQIRELLGDDGELEASLLEDRWASGIAVAASSSQRKQDSIRAGADSVLFSELSSFGGFCYSQPEAPTGDRPPRLRPVDRASSYHAAWLYETSERMVSAEENASKRNDTECGSNACASSNLGSETYQRACELLGVSDKSTATQIRHAYRRMAGRWHPDRLEQSADEVRVFATGQMSAINQAYALLRELPLAATC